MNRNDVLEPVLPEYRPNLFISQAKGLIGFSELTTLVRGSKIIYPCCLLSLQPVYIHVMVGQNLKKYINLLLHRSLDYYKCASNFRVTRSVKIEEHQCDSYPRLLLWYDHRLSHLTTRSVIIYEYNRTRVHRGYPNHLPLSNHHTCKPDDYSGPNKHVLHTWYYAICHLSSCRQSKLSSD